MNSRCVGERAAFQPRAASGRPRAVSTDSPKTASRTASGRHWLMLFRGQGARLLVYVILRGHGLRPRSDTVSKCQGLDFGFGKWPPGSRCGSGTAAREGHTCCRSRPRPPRGESHRLLVLEAPSPTRGAWATRTQRGSREGGLACFDQGIGRDPVEYKCPLGHLRVPVCPQVPACPLICVLGTALPLVRPPPWRGPSPWKPQPWSPRGIPESQLC